MVDSGLNIGLGSLFGALGVGALGGILGVLICFAIMLAKYPVIKKTRNTILWIVFFSSIIISALVGSLILGVNFHSDADMINLIAVLVIINIIIAIIGGTVYRSIVNKIVEKENAKKQKEPEKKSKNKAPAIIVGIVIAILVMIMVALLFNRSSPNSNSEGTNTCKNCGRSPVVAGFGYCEDCYDGFVDWQEDNWK